MIKFLKRIFWVTAILLISPIAIWWAWYEGSILYDLYTGKMPMYDIKAELKVGEEIVKIERLIPCEKVYQSETIPYLFTWNKRPWRAFPRDGSIGVKLPDGRAVVIAIPSICRKLWEANQSKNWESLLPHNYIPLVGILDEWPSPNHIKILASREYYTRSDNDFSIVSYSLSAAKPGNLPEYRSEFNWFGEAAFPIDGQEHRFRSQELIEVPYGLLNLNEKVLKNLGEGDQPVFLSEEIALLKTKFVSLLEPALVTHPFVNLVNTKVDKDVALSYGAIVPIVKVNESFNFDLDYKGVIHAYILPANHKLDPKNTNWGDFFENALTYKNKKIDVSGKAKKSVGAGPLVYFPKTGKFYLVKNRWQYFNY